jgi:hypothetical protein
VIVLAHNASVAEVPFDFVRLFEEPTGGLYGVALTQLVEQVQQSREQAAKSRPS